MSPSYTFHNESLQIHDFNNLPALRQELKANASLHSQTKYLEVLNLDEEDVEYEAPPRPSPYTMEIRKREAQDSIERGEELSKYIAEIIALINDAGAGLEVFKWRNSYGVNYIRSNVFWDALWATTGKLKGLELGFYKDELAVDRHGLLVVSHIHTLLPFLFIVVMSIEYSVHKVHHSENPGNRRQQRPRPRRIPS